MLLKGKVAVVTGCNRGIGKSIMELFAKNGATIWACARKPDEDFSQRIADLSSQFGVTITPIFFDLEDGDAVKHGAKKILAEGKHVDILVNNAGAVFTALFQMTSSKKLKEMFDINFFSQMIFTQIIIKAMIRNGGSIINVSSSSAIECNEGRVAYSSSKAALISFTKTISKELAKSNIRANAIAPGLTETDMMTQGTPEDVVTKTLERIPMGRVGNPEEIANVALFLASELSTYMTGQVLRVDGGMIYG
jgi:3-oxoacyl-[acyl-carrier protein] reductase